MSIASQEIPRILLNPKVRHRIHEIPSTLPLLSQINPFHASSSPFLKLHFHIILPSTPTYYRSPGLPTKILYAPLLSPIRATCSVHPILLDLITRLTFGEQYRTLSSSLCSFLLSCVTSSHSASSSAPYSQTPSAYVPPSM